MGDVFTWLVILLGLFIGIAVYILGKIVYAVLINKNIHAEKAGTWQAVTWLIGAIIDIGLMIYTFIQGKFPWSP